MTDRELMQQALDAMLNFPNDISDEMFESIKSLRARLAQPDREWVTLTDDEIRIAWGPYFSRGVDVARVIEAMLKKRNT